MARRSYQKLGLMTTPNPRLSGGLEALPIGPFAYKVHQQQPAAETPEASTSKLPVLENGKIPKGYARVERDAEGKIIKVTLAEDEEDEAKTAWGEPFEAGETELEAIEVDMPQDEGINRTQGIPFAMDTPDGIVIPRIPAKEPTETVKGKARYLCVLSV
jgi:nucleolar protein 16